MAAKTHWVRNSVNKWSSSHYRFNEPQGNVYYVDSAAADAADESGAGWTPEYPFATIDYAIGQCTANNDDVVYVMPGHNEGLGSGQSIDADVAGISIIGLGTGSNRPRIDFDHATAIFSVGAANVLIKNLTFLPSVATVAKGVDIETGVKWTRIEDCEWLDGEASGTDEFVIGLCLTTGNDFTTIKNCRYSVSASADGAASFIKLDAVCDMVTIKDCVSWGPYSTAAVACINGDTTASTRILVQDCTLVTDDEPGIELLTGSTGVFKNVAIFSNLATIAAATVADGVAHFGVKYVELGNESDAVVKTASADD